MKIKFFSYTDKVLYGQEEVTKFRTTHISAQKQLRFNVQTFLYWFSKIYVLVFVVFLYCLLYFCIGFQKWGLVPSPNCECGASEQTADHVLTMCPIHRAPHGARGLTVLDDKTRCWFNDITASI